ncbi:hypothetical protein KKC67_01190 [Patescibacteria group bacterium]|nr:hypothetical protein [Patescibacteria group bacterium]MBU1991612.1 hypothetical protein [Patescibacteria group bacterium]
MNIKILITAIIILILLIGGFFMKNYLNKLFEMGNKTASRFINYKDSVIFPADYDVRFLVKKNNKRFTPTNEEINIAMSILRPFLLNKESNESSEIYRETIQRIKNYRVQFFGYINQEGEKIIWANYFCDAYEKNWQKNLIFVKDGGNCYFNIKVNLDTKEIFDFIVNGDA